MDAGKKMDMFKLGLVRSVDPHFTRQVMTVEVDFWWVGVPKISSAVAIDAKSKQAAGGEEDVEPFEEEPPPTKKKPKKLTASAVRQFWDTLTDGAGKKWVVCNLDISPRSRPSRAASSRALRPRRRASGPSATQGASSASCAAV